MYLAMAVSLQSPINIITLSVCAWIFHDCYFEFENYFPKLFFRYYYWYFKIEEVVLNLNGLY